MARVAHPNTSCLHLVAAAGAQALEDCLAHCRPGDAILFLDAGVLHLLDSRLTNPQAGEAVLLFAGADLEAHGLLAMARAAGAATATDADLCRLLAEHRHCLTWI